MGPKFFLTTIPRFALCRSNASVTNMYGDKMYLFSELVEAHKKNDRAVMKAYGFEKRPPESEMVSELFNRYLKITAEQALAD